MTVEGHRQLSNCDENAKEDIYLKGYLTNKYLTKTSP